MALSNKQQIFVEEYLATWNATESARRAGYSHANTQGPRLLVNVGIAAEIKARVADKTLTADEVLVRLAEHARGSMGDFIRFDDNGNPLFDLQAASLLGKMPLVKKLKTKTRTYTQPTITVTGAGQAEDAEEEGRVEIDSVEVTETSIEFELYDAQAALVHIGKHHNLFTDGPTGTEKDPIHIKHIKEVRPSDDSTAE